MRRSDPSLIHRCMRTALLIVDRRLVCAVTALASQEEDMGHFDAVEPLEESTTSLVSSSTSAYSSFPVDVVVYVRVQVLLLACHSASSVAVFNWIINFLTFPTHTLPHSTIRRMGLICQSNFM